MTQNSNTGQNEQEQGLVKFLGVKDVDHIAVADGLHSAILDGFYNPIDIHITIKKMEKIIESFKKHKGVSDIIQEEITKHLSSTEKSVTFGDAKLSIAPVYTAYDFTTCKDVYYDELKKIQIQVNELVKAREEELKSMFSNVTNKLGIQSRTVIIERLPILEWGEVGEDNVIFSPVKKQRDGVKTTFIKRS